MTMQTKRNEVMRYMELFKWFELLLCFKQNPALLEDDKRVEKHQTDTIYDNDQDCKRTVCQYRRIITTSIQNTHLTDKGVSGHKSAICYICFLAELSFSWRIRVLTPYSLKTRHFGEWSKPERSSGRDLSLRKENISKAMMGKFSVNTNELKESLYKYWQPGI